MQLNPLLVIAYPCLHRHRGPFSVSTQLDVDFESHLISEQYFLEFFKSIKKLSVQVLRLANLKLVLFLSAMRFFMM